MGLNLLIADFHCPIQLLIPNSSLSSSLIMVPKYLYPVYSVIIHLLAPNLVTFYLKFLSDMVLSIPRNHWIIAIPRYLSWGIECRIWFIRNQRSPIFRKKPYHPNCFCWIFLSNVIVVISIISRTFSLLDMPADRRQK